MVQPMVVQMQPSEQLGVDVDVMQTNRIQTIDDGLIAELNKVYPGSVEIGDRILEVDGKAGAAVDNTRDWVAARDPAAGPANLHLAVARQATYANGVLGDGLEFLRDGSRSARPIPRGERRRRHQPRHGDR